MKINDENNEELKIKNITITSQYTYDKITSLFKNFETISFVNLILNYNLLLEKGYNKIFLIKSLHSMLSMPFFLFHNDGIGLNFNNEHPEKS